jgi:O-antigen ligase
MVYWIYHSRNPIKSIRNALLSIAVIVTGWYAMMYIPFLYNLLGRRIESMLAGFLGLSTDASTSTRLRLIRIGWAWFLQRPWVGYGLGNFGAMNLTLNNSVLYAHNNYIELLVDSGLIGTFIYYSLYANTIRRFFMLDSSKKKSFCFLMGIVISFLIADYGIVSYNLAVFQLIVMCLNIMIRGRLTTDRSETGERAL